LLWLNIKFNFIVENNLLGTAMKLFVLQKPEIGY